MDGEHIRVSSAKLAFEVVMAEVDLLRAGEFAWQADGAGLGEVGVAAAIGLSRSKKGTRRSFRERGQIVDGTVDKVVAGLCFFTLSQEILAMRSRGSILLSVQVRAMPAG